MQATTGSAHRDVRAGDAGDVAGDQRDVGQAGQADARQGQAGLQAALGQDAAVEGTRAADGIICTLTRYCDADSARASGQTLGAFIQGGGLRRLLHSSQRDILPATGFRENY